MWSDPRVKPPPGVAAWNPESWAAPGCVAYLACNEGGGSRVFDYSPYGHHGTMSSGMDPQTAWGAGESGAALEFAGGDDYVAVQPIAPLQGVSAATFCVWMNPTNAAETQWVIARGDYHFASFMGLWGDDVAGEITNTYVFNVGISTVAANRVTAPTDSRKTGEWQMVAAVFDAGNKKIYVDGSLVGEASGGQTTIVSSATAWDIGAWTFSGAYSAMQIEQHACYDRALATKEIERLHEEPYAPIVQPPRVWYFDVGAVAFRPRPFTQHRHGPRLVTGG